VSSRPDNTTSPSLRLVDPSAKEVGRRSLERSSHENSALRELTVLVTDERVDRLDNTTLGLDNLDVGRTRLKLNTELGNHLLDMLFGSTISPPLDVVGLDMLGILVQKGHGDVETSHWNLSLVTLII
jgi:hypothetical protein